MALLKFLFFAIAALALLSLLVRAVRERMDRQAPVDDEDERLRPDDRSDVSEHEARRRPGPD